MKKRSLIGLTPGVNFINILRSTFFIQKCFVQLFSSYILALAFFVQNIGAQAARKMMVKLTTACLRIAER